MRAVDLRKRVLERAAEASESGDEENIANVLAFARALLVAIASDPVDGEVDPEGLTVKTGTAARILGRHPEYVRDLVRRGEITAEKKNGEFSIPLSEVIRSQAKVVRASRGRSHLHQWGPLGSLLGPSSTNPQSSQAQRP